MFFYSDRHLGNTPHGTPHGGASTYSRNSLGGDSSMPVASVESPATPAPSPHPNSAHSQPTSVPPAEQVSESDDPKTNVQTTCFTNTMSTFVHFTAAQYESSCANFRFQSPTAADAYRPPAGQEYTGANANGPARQQEHYGLALCSSDAKRGAALVYGSCGRRRASWWAGPWYGSR